MKEEATHQIRKESFESADKQAHQLLVCEVVQQIDGRSAHSGQEDKWASCVRRLCRESGSTVRHTYMPAIYM